MHMQLKRFPVEETAGPVAGLAEVTAPFSIPQDFTVLYTAARPLPPVAEAQNDQITLSGDVVFTVLGTREGKPASIGQTVHYAQTLAMPGCNPKMRPEAQARLESIEDRRGVFSAALRLAARASEIRQTEFVSGVDEDGDTQTRVQPVESLCRQTQTSVEIPVEESFELPYGMPSENVLLAVPQIRQGKAQSGEGFVAAAADLVLQVVHSTGQSGHPISVTRHVVPLKADLEMQGQTAETPFEVTFAPLDFSLSLESDEEATRLVAHGKVRADAVGYSLWRGEALQDAYRTDGAMLDMETGKVRTVSGHTAASDTQNVQATLTIPEDAPAASAVLAVFALPAAEWTEEEGGMTAAGTVVFSVLYADSETGQARVVAEEIPFQTRFQIPNGILTLEPVEVEAALVAPRSIDVRAALSASSRSVQTGDASLVFALRENEEKRELPAGIFLYYLQDGDDGWSVAKRFGVPRDQLEKRNPGLDQMKAGDSVVLYRRRSV